MVLSDTNCVMLPHAFWATFMDRRHVDPAKEAQVLLCISREDRAAVSAGGTADPCAAQDHGFMYGRSFADPDGHVREPMWMSAEAVEKGPAEVSNAG